MVISWLCQIVAARAVLELRRGLSWQLCGACLSQFVITVVVTFTTFAVYRARHGTLVVANVFYAVALLQLPRRTMNAFVSGGLVGSSILEFG
jgi:hypothetical protein